jgi:hypothetical protein
MALFTEVAEEFAAAVRRACRDNLFNFVAVVHQSNRDSFFETRAGHLSNTSEQFHQNVTAVRRSYRDSFLKKKNSYRSSIKYVGQSRQLLDGGESTTSGQFQ